MDYKKAYEDLVAKLRDARNGEDQDERFCVVIDQIHPGLEESEDEKIIRGILEYLYQYKLSISEKEYESWRGWLSKQMVAKWSEEDEVNFAWFDKFFRAESVIANGRDIPQDKYQWFKSLRPQNHWKPSEEQLRDLKLIADQNAANMLGNNLVNLYNDLQKL